MVNKSNRFTNLFYRYLISYILLFLIPLILFGTILYVSSFKIFKKEMEDYNKSKLYQTMGFLDNQLKNLEKIAVNISFNKNLYPYIIEDSSYWQNNEFMELRTYLANNTVNNEIIDEIILYLNNKDFMFTSRGKTSMETLFDNIVRISSKDASSLIKKLQHLELPEMLKIPKRDKDTSLPVQDPFDVFQDSEKNYTFYAYPAYLYPIPQVKGDTYGTVVFRINCSKLNDIMQATLGDMVGEVHIFTDDFEELYSIESGKLISSIEIKDVLKNGNNKQRSYYKGKYGQQVCNTTYINNKISVIDIQSKLTGYHYVTVLNIIDYFNKVANMQKNIFILLVSVVLAGIAMSTVLAFKNYRPVWSLMKLMNVMKNSKINDKDKNIDEDKNIIYYFKNEFDEIETSIYDMLEENRVLTDKVKLQRPYVEDQIISMLLKGSIHNKSKIIDILSISDIKMTDQYFTVLILSTCNNRESANDVSFSELSYCINIFLRQNFCGNFYSLEMLKGNIIIILNSGYEDLSRDNLQELLTGLQALLYRNSKIRVNIGVGRIYGDILDISTSFNEALSALDYNLIKGSGELLFFEDIIDIDDNIYWYPIEQQTRLIQFLRQGDIDMFNSELSKICDTIKKRNNSTGMIKAICFGIVNCIINVVNELDTEEFTDEVEDMLKFKSLEELQDRMKKMAASICNFINEKKQCGNEALKNAMLEFIHENYTENGLCLDMLAEELNLTSKYLSKVFKEQVGCRFGDYVRQIRIKNAKKLLIDTDMTIKEIVSEIGYGDTANFIRTFRIFEGVTPGDFRKIRS